MRRRIAMVGIVARRIGTANSSDDHEKVSRMTPRAHATSTTRWLLAALLGATCCFPSTGWGDEPEIDATRARALAEAAMKGDGTATEALLALGPRVLPSIEKLVIAGNAEKQLDEWVARWANTALDVSLRDEPGLIYHGQFRALVPLGARGSRALLVVLKNEDEPRNRRSRAAIAMGDIGDRSALPALRLITDDFLTETWLEEDVGYLMARLGDRAYVDRRLAAASEIVKLDATLGNLPLVLAAHTELAQIYYRTESYGEAIKHYQQKLAILSDLAGRVRVELRRGVEEEIALLHYNLSCSLSLDGRIDDCMNALRRAIRHDQVTLAMVKADGDLRALRADPRYEKFFAELESIENEGAGGEEGDASTPMTDP